MKNIFLMTIIYFLAFSIARAETGNATDTASGVTEVAVNECQDLLPQLENDLQELDRKYQTLTGNISSLQENYLISFNEMTGVLLQMAQAREEETQKISQSRDGLNASLQKFNQLKSQASSNALQASYLDLTMRLYSALADSQKSLESLKGQLTQVENSRMQFAAAQNELEETDKQKLALEAKLINLKIKCRPDRYY